MFQKALEILRNSSYFIFKEHVFDVTQKSISLRHYTGFDCKITFNEINGYYKMHGIKHWLKLQDPEARKLMIFFRKLFEFAELQEANLNAGCLDMMVIYFLQAYGYLPSFKEMQKNSSKRTCIEFHDKTLTDYGNSLIGDYRNLVPSFLQYFVKFSFQTYVVCPYLGSDVKRLEFSNRSDLNV